MIIRNIAAINYIEILKKYLDRQDLLGYAAARNIRHLEQSSTEYIEMRDRLVLEYGEDETDENGVKTGRRIVKPGSTNFNIIMEKLNKFSLLTHEVEIYKIPYEEVKGKLTGHQILELDWMLED